MDEREDILTCDTRAVIVDYERAALKYLVLYDKCDNLSECETYRYCCWAGCSGHSDAADSSLGNGNAEGVGL
jgi:hypothetical protein